MHIITSSLERYQTCKLALDITTGEDLYAVSIPLWSGLTIHTTQWHLRGKSLYLQSTYCLGSLLLLFFALFFFRLSVTVRIPLESTAHKEAVSNLRICNDTNQAQIYFNLVFQYLRYRVREWNLGSEKYFQLCMKLSISDLRVTMFDRNTASNLHNLK